MSAIPSVVAIMLCEVCAGNLQHLHGLVAKSSEAMILLHQPTFTALATTAQAGCPICRGMWQRLTEDEQNLLVESDAQAKQFSNIITLSSEEDLRADAMDNFATLLCIVPKLEGMEAMVSGGIMVMLQSQRPIAEHITHTNNLFVLEDVPKVAVNHRLADSTASMESWAIAQEWINKCTTAHKQCQNVEDPAWYPTRLLELCKSGHVKLIENTHETATGRYCTLSHRWGSSKPYCLSASTIESLRTGVPILSLPHAFQDAITICRRLEVGLLWIDSLCIIQDRNDLTDWMKEAALMHKVYTSSYLNISALAAADSEHSFFVDRDASLLNETRVQTGLRGFELDPVCREYTVTDLMFWEKSLEVTLNLRGWVLQERLLARRVLHFGQEQLIWECREHEATESFPGGLPEHRRARFKSFDPSLFRAQEAPEIVSSDSGPYDKWKKIVQKYSKCALTKDEDKLIAIAGIAKFMTTLTNDEYIAGMWRKYLGAEILWHVDVPRGTSLHSHRLSCYVAPSWSWASVNTPVSISHHSAENLEIEVVDVKLEHATDDVTGLVVGGWLLLACQLHHLIITEELDSSVFYWSGLTIDGVKVDSTVPPEPRRWKQGSALHYLDENPTFFNPVNRDDLFCVPARFWGTNRMLDVLVLQLVDAETGTFRRIGLMTAVNERHARALEAVFRLPQSGALPCVSFDSGKHIIRII